MTGGGDRGEIIKTIKKNSFRSIVIVSIGLLSYCAFSVRNKELAQRPASSPHTAYK